MPVSRRPLLQLTIRRQRATNIVDLNIGEPLIHQSEAKADAALLQGLDDQFRHLAASSRLVGDDKRGDALARESDTVVNDLRSLGKLIFSQLLPVPIRQHLSAAEPADLYLRLDEQLIHLPWELAFDGTDFLATKFCVGRQVITNVPSLKKRMPRAETGLLRVLLVADPTESLPKARSEAEQLCALLDKVRGVKVTLVGGRLVEKADLLNKLQTHDVVHFAGHSHYDPASPARSGWHLRDSILTAEELSKLQDPPRLVFSNSCQAGATPAGHYQYEGQAFGIGSAFLLAGVTNYIGTFWVVHDEESMHFAEAFYQGVATGLSVGEALLRARKETIRQHGWQGLTWASYMLYGDPTVTLLPQAEEQPIVEAAGNSYARDLVAILSADVAGYSRHMSQNDVATVQTLNAYRRIMKDRIRDHQGEVIDSPGDNLLAFFRSVASAVQCAVEIQRELKARNTELPAERRLQYRIGINSGDVIKRVDGSYGDGINIAARVEKLARPGGICVSGFVYEQVKNRLHSLNVEYQYLGMQRLHNIPQSVAVYLILIDPVLSRFRLFRTPRISRQYPLLQWRTTGIVVLVSVVVVFFIWWKNPPPPPPSSPPLIPFAVVVRPFKAIKVESPHAWIPGGILARLSSELSKVEGLTVYISDHFDFLLNRCDCAERDLAEKLGITKMIQGSLIAEGPHLRIEAHLVDVRKTAREPSVESQGQQADLFVLIDELAAKLMVQLKVPIPAAPPEGTPASGVPSPDFLKSIIEGEGETPTVKSPQEKSAPTLKTPPQRGEPQSWIPQWEDWLAVSVAWADEPSSQEVNPEDEIHQVLKKYGQAYEQKDPELLATVYQTFTPAQQEANEKYFQNTQDLRVTIRNVDITVQGDEAAVSYTREDEFTDVKTKQKVKLVVRFTKIFVRTENGWKMVVGKK